MTYDVQRACDLRFSMIYGNLRKREICEQMEASANAVDAAMRADFESPSILNWRIEYALDMLIIPSWPPRSN